jgi:hypothetical protein
MKLTPCKECGSKPRFRKEKYKHHDSNVQRIELNCHNSRKVVFMYGDREKHLYKIYIKQAFTRLRRDWNET